MSYDTYGNRKSWTQAERDALTARIAAEDAERARNANGWARLCGMASPIGGPSTR